MTIPVEIRRALGVGPHNQVAFVVEDNQVHLRPAKGVVARTAGALNAYFSQPALSAEDERERFEVGVAQEVAECANRLREDAVRRAATARPDCPQDR